MILHGISIRNWKNIGALELPALNRSLCILHGPNRTGKSSIVQAIRCCLFDYDHDSSSQEIRRASPWRIKESPEIVVDFEAGGTRYRLTKCFSTRKDGDAILEKQTADDRWTVVERGKEGSRQARIVLGGEKSDDGLNQLLWLTQGQFRLPETKELDLSLRKRFEGILGSLLTAHDVDFHDLLKEQCRQFYTSKGKERAASPVAKLRQRQEQAHIGVNELRQRVDESQTLVRQYDELQVTLDDLRTHIDQSTATVDALRSQVESIADKRRRHEAALSELGDAQQQLTETEERLARHRELREKLIQCERELDSTAAAIETTESRQTEIAAELAERAESLKALKGDRADVDQQRAELDDKRRLVDLADERRRLGELIDRDEQLERELAILNGEPHQTATADEKELKQLRKNRSDAEKLRATIEAAALRIELEPDKTLAIDLSIDDEGSASLDVQTPQQWQFRQQVQLRLNDVGLVRVVRGTNDESLEESARKLEQLDEKFTAAMAGFGIAPEDEQWMETLVRRAAERNALKERIEEKERQRGDLCPEGIDAARQQCDRLVAEQQVLLERTPALADWTPQSDSVTAAEKELAKRSRSIRSAEESLEQELDQLRKQESAAKRTLEEHRIQQAARGGDQKNFQDRLAELGDEFTLKQSVEAAKTGVTAAEAKVTENSLTPGEEQTAEKLEQEEGALEQREERFRRVELQAREIRGQLRDRAGLHEQTADAEAELERATVELQRAELDAESHRLLLEMFEACRDEQVRRTVGPIEDQLLQWTGRLGLDEYQSVAFHNDGYLPSGLMRDDVETAVALDDESYGTLEQLALLVRLASGRLLAREEPHLAILDDPLTHADSRKHRAMLDILEEVTRPPAAGDETGIAPLQLLIFTCHPERFDHLRNAHHVDLVERIQRT